MNANNDSDYEDEVVSDSDDMIDNSDSDTSDSESADTDNDNTNNNHGNGPQIQQPVAPARGRSRPRGRRPQPPPNKFETGWSAIYNPDQHYPFHFNPRPRFKENDFEPGPKNIPNSINANSVSLDFLDL